MKRLALSILASLLACLATTAWAADAVPTTGTLESLPLGDVKWAGPAVNVKALEGKTVIVLVWASWCPKCNAWSGKLFDGLKKGTAGKPIVILAINADTSPAGVEKYLTDHGFFAPNIVHGYDPGIKQKMGLETELFQYTLVSPAGKVVDKGAAGAFMPDGQIYLLTKLERGENLGTFKIMPEEPSEAVAAALWPMELGSVTDAALTKVKKTLSSEDKAAVETAVSDYLAKQLEEIATLKEGEAEDKFQAYEKAAALAKDFRAAPEGKKAKEMVTSLDKDGAFKREVAAKKAYDGCMAKTSLSQAKRDVLMKSIAERFSGTVYGKKAEESVGGA